jgi:hypothetical protein
MIGTRIVRFWVVLCMTAFSACDEGTRARRASDGGLTDVVAETSALSLPGDAPFLPLPPGPDGFVAQVCNGAPALCDRSYDSIVFLATHQSAAVGDSWSTPTQGRSLEEQLAIGGVRAFELEVHLDGGVLTLCAGSCADGSQSLSGALHTVEQFLGNNPNDVLTLLVRSRVPAATLVPAFDAARLTALAHAQLRSRTWPTLREMIAAGHRLVVFVDESGSGSDAGSTSDASRGGGRVPGAGADATADSGPASLSPPWIHRASDWMWETAPSVAIECVPEKGDPRNPLIVLNHYEVGMALTDAGLLAVHDAETVALRLERCRDDRGRLPTLLVVDFADRGDPNGGVQIANGLR